MENLNLDKDTLEKALNSNAVVEEAPKEASMPEISKEEEIGFHKGCLNTLAAERNELVKMIQNVEAIMQAHIKRLEELGVKIPVEKK
jgi:hypothetical protein